MRLMSASKPRIYIRNNEEVKDRVTRLNPTNDILQTVLSFSTPTVAPEVPPDDDVDATEIIDEAIGSALEESGLAIRYLKKYQSLLKVEREFILDEDNKDIVSGDYKKKIDDMLNNVSKDILNSCPGISAVLKKLAHPGNASKLDIIIILSFESSKAGMLTHSLIFPLTLYRNRGSNWR